MNLLEIFAFVWAVSASIALEAYGEAFADQQPKPWTPILIGSLTPILNTLIAAYYARDKLKGIFK